MKKYIYIIAGLVFGVLITALFLSLREISRYREAYDLLKSVQNTVIMKMDESCYDQFKNNYDKTLYLKVRFEE